MKIRDSLLRLLFYIPFNYVICRFLNSLMFKIIYNFRHNVNNIHAIVVLTNQLPKNMIFFYCLGVIQTAGIFVFELILMKMRNRLQKEKY